MWPFYTLFFHCARSTLFQWQRQAHLIFLSILHWRVFVMLLRGDIGSRAFSVVCVAVLMLVCCVCGSTYEDLLLDESLHRRQHPEIDWWRSIGIPSTRWSRPTLFPSVFQSPFRISCGEVRWAKKNGLQVKLDNKSIFCRMSSGQQVTITVISHSI